MIGFQKSEKSLRDLLDQREIYVILINNETELGQVNHFSINFIFDCEIDFELVSDIELTKKIEVFDKSKIEILEYEVLCGDKVVEKLIKKDLITELNVKICDKMLRESIYYFEQVVEEIESEDGTRRRT